MRASEQFIQVTGHPAGVAGQILILKDTGQEYLIQEVETLTVYHLREATPAEAMADPHRVLIQDGDLRLVYLERDLRSRGLHVALREMEHQKMIRERRERRLQRRRGHGP